MSFEFNYPFLNSGNYVFPSDKIEVTGGYAQLKLEDNPGQTFSGDLSTATFDQDFIEYVAGVLKQKDQRPENSILAVKYTSSVNANWAADGFIDTSAVLNGAPVLSSGKLLCTGSNGLYYTDPLIGNLSGNFVVKFKYTPNYNTGPSTNVNLFTLTPVSGLTNAVCIFNSPAGNNIRITCNGLSANSFDVWTPTLGQEYIFEIICINNQISVYIDGVQIGGTKTITPGMANNSVRAWVGACATIYNNANGEFDDFIIYSTSIQDENYTIPETIYSAASAVLPELEYTGVGTLLSFDTFSTTETGFPRYILQIDRSGDYVYWNGAAWVVSSETYAQGTSQTDFNNNCLLINVNGKIYGQFKILFGDSNNQSSVSVLEAILTSQIYPVTNPYIEPTIGIIMEELIVFSSLFISAGLDDIRYVLKKDNAYYYYNGTTWAISDGSYSLATTNTLTEIQENVETFTTVGIVFKPRAFIHSETGQTTPKLDYINGQYDFFASAENIETCTVWGYNLNDGGSADASPFTIQLSQDAVKYKTSTILRNDIITVTPDPLTGYWDIQLIETENMGPGAFYNFIFGDKIYSKKIPNEASKKFWLLDDET